MTVSGRRIADWRRFIGWTVLLLASTLQGAPGPLAWPLASETGSEEILKQGARRTPCSTCSPSTSGSSCRKVRDELMAAIGHHVLGSGEFTATYRRRP